MFREPSLPAKAGKRLITPQYTERIFPASGKKNIHFPNEYTDNDFLKGEPHSVSVQEEPSLRETKFGSGFKRRPQVQIGQDELRLQQEELRLKRQENSLEKSKKLYLEHNRNGYNPVTGEVVDPERDTPPVQKLSFRHKSVIDQLNYVPYNHERQLLKESREEWRRQNIQNEGLRGIKKDWGVADQLSCYDGYPVPEAVSMDGTRRKPKPVPAEDPQLSNTITLEYRAEVKKLIGDSAQKTIGNSAFENVRQRLISANSHNALNMLRRNLKRMKISQSSGEFWTPQQLSNALQLCSVRLSPAELDAMFKHFQGKVNEDILLKALRGDLNPRRLHLIKTAFAVIDVNCDGQVTVADLASLYDASKHPDVIAARKTKDAVLTEFLAQWNRNNDSCVTLSEFIESYADISACINCDDYFELMVRNAWHLSGGEGIAANTSCRRVLVTHTDGSQSVQEIKNDLGVKYDKGLDMQWLIKRLEAQGVTDIKSVSLK